MTDNNSHLEIAWSSINVFANDGKLDMDELNFLLGIALRDNNINDDEKGVLKSIFDQVSPLTEDQSVIEKIKEIKKKYNIT